MRMMVEMSRLAHAYGLERVDLVSGDGRRVFGREDGGVPALEEVGEVFANCRAWTRFLFPAAIRPHPPMMGLLEKETEVLRRYHPKAQMWVSPAELHPHVDG